MLTSRNYSLTLQPMPLRANLSLQQTSQKCPSLPIWGRALCKPDSKFNAEYSDAARIRGCGLPFSEGSFVKGCVERGKFSSFGAVLRKMSITQRGSTARHRAFGGQIGSTSQPNFAARCSKQPVRSVTETCETLTAASDLQAVSVERAGNSTSVLVQSKVRCAVGNCRAAQGGK